LYENIIHEDEDIVAIDKPFGVGIHKPHPTITRQNSDQMMEAVKFGDPRFSIDDGLIILREKLHTKDLKVSRSIDRFESGIILLSKTDLGAAVIQRVANYHKPQGIPFAKYWCITKGYPVIPGNFISEKVTLMKTDVDELAEYREPILVKKKAFKSRYLQAHEQDFVSGMAEMRVLETNRELAVSLVEIASNQHKFSFVRCYAASKTSFILGDVRFAKRVRYVLGKPFTLNPQAVPDDPHYEPLQFGVRKKLLVPSNSAVPLMVHLKSIIVPELRKRKALIISTTKLPEHFEWTLHRLQLKHQEPRTSSSDDKSQEKKKYLNN
jgi:23S rRNA-/tRNA-specific pseudouridylate synthase